MKNNFRFGVSIGLFINFINIMLGIKRQCEFNSLNINGYCFECPWSVYNIFIFCNTETEIAKIYLYFIPIITSLVVFSIKCKGFFDGLIKSFCLGFFVTFITLLCSLFVTFLVFPAIKPEISTGYFPLAYRGCILNDVYQKFPFLYIIMFILLFSIFSGMFAMISNTSKTIFKSIWSVMIFSFLLNIVMSNLLMEFDCMESMPVYLLIPTETFYGTSLNDYFICFISLIFVLIIIMLIGYSDKILRKKVKK